MENKVGKYVRVNGLRYDCLINMDWTPEEQQILEKSLAEPYDGHFAIRYAMIASRLNDKTARDVALRRRWMILRDEKEAPASEKTKSNDEKEEQCLEEKVKSLMRENRVMFDRIKEIGSDLRLFEERTSLLELTRKNLMKIQQELEKAPFESPLPMPPLPFF